ncbi:MAG: RidA family protein [Hyphomicrobiaceae bacterium]
MADPIVYKSVSGLVTGDSYSHVTLANGFAFLAGQVPSDDEANRTPSGNIEEETRAAMDNLARVLRAAGLDFEDVVRTNVYMADLGEFERMNSVYVTYFPKGRLPARTTVGVAQLIDGCRIEIDCIARLK